MTAKILNFSGVTRLDMSPDSVLEPAIGRLESVLVIGYDKDGEEYFASSIADGGTVLWLLERMKKALLEVADDEG